LVRLRVGLVGAGVFVFRHGKTSSKEHKIGALRVSKQDCYTTLFALENAKNGVETRF
jgi:hypothetical protein